MKLVGLTAITLVGAASLLMPGVACSPGGEPASQSGNLDQAQEEPCVPPKIQFVVDASASMLEPIGGEGVAEDLTKWQALSGAVARVTTTHEGAALYGLTTFPGATGGCTAGDMQIAPGPNNEAAINAKIAELAIAPDSATPAGQTLMAVSRYEEMLDENQERYVVFISDGWQYCSVPGQPGEGEGASAACFNQGDCEAMGLEGCSSCNSCQIDSEDAACERQNADGCYCVRNWPLLGVQALADAGIKTYVVGFGHNVDATTLNQAAVAAGTDLPGCDPASEEPSCFLNATSTGQLGDVLEKIMLRVSSAPCEGGCGLTGKKQCSLAGWSECAAPESIACTADCGAEGVQQCVSGVLSDCDAQCAVDAGGAGGQPIATGGSGAGGSGAGGSGEGASGAGASGAGGSSAGGSSAGGSSAGGSSAGGSSAGGAGGAGAPEQPPPSYGGSSSDPWEDDDYDDDYYGDEEGGGSSTWGSNPDDEGGCSFAVGAGQPAHVAWMLSLGLTLWRRRRSVGRARSRA